MSLIVHKYGGTSVGSSEKIKKVAKKIVQCKNNGNQVVVVVSAMGDTTDKLVSLAKELHDFPPEREMDMLLSTGEQISIALLAIAIKSMGQSVVSLTGSQVGIFTNDIHTKASILKIDNTRLNKELNDGNIVIVAGFQGVTSNNEITTLGRGGSDTSAVAIAAALDAELCEIYTDVDGVYTADPRITPNAKKLKQISFDEMLELSSLGAQVLHPRSVEMAKAYNIKLSVRSSFNNIEGTCIKEVDNMEKQVIVSGVAHDLNAAKIGIFDVPDTPGIANKVFTSLADIGVNVDMIIQSTTRDKKLNDISFTVAKDDSKKAVKLLEELKDKINAGGIISDEEVAKISIVGAGMYSNPGVASRMFKALAKSEINIQMISTSEIKISCIIETSKINDAVKSLVDEFDLKDKNAYMNNAC